MPPPTKSRMISSTSVMALHGNGAEAGGCRAMMTRRWPHTHGVRTAATSCRRDVRRPRSAARGCARCARPGRRPAGRPPVPDVRLDDRGDAREPPVLLAGVPRCHGPSAAQRTRPPLTRVECPLARGRLSCNADASADHPRMRVHAAHPPPRSRRRRSPWRRTRRGSPAARDGSGFPSS